MADVIEQRAARVRAAQVRAGMLNYLQVLAVVAEAYAQNDHITLGYGTWQEYVDGEYPAVRLKLSEEDRDTAVAALRVTGAMSLRQIGRTLGISHTEARRCIARASSGGTQVPTEVVGSDGKSYAAARPTTPRPFLVEAKGRVPREVFTLPPPSGVRNTPTPEDDADSKLRERLHSRLHTFWSAVWSGIEKVDPAEVARVADEQLLVNIEAASREMNEWANRVMDLRRRATIRAVV